MNQSELRTVIENSMSKIKKLFDELKIKKPYWSDIIIFNTCISGKKFDKVEISKMFRKLVDKNEYSGVNINKLLEHSKKLTKQTSDLVSVNKN